jgi:hypothetical protein
MTMGGRTNNTLFQVGFFGFCTALYAVFPYQIYADTDIRYPFVYSVFASASLFGALSRL